MSQSRMEAADPYNSRLATRNPGPLFSSLDFFAGIVAFIMILGPLCGAAFVIGRY